MDNRIINKVEQLKLNTESNIKDIQKNKIPISYDMGLLYKDYYTYNGYKYTTNMPHVQIYLAKNIPYKHDSNTTYIDSLVNLISSGKITPFILLINDKFIKWSNIIVIHDLKYSYLMINNISDTIYDNLKTIILPCKIRYGENNSILSGNKMNFYFNKNGIIDNINIDSRIEIIDEDMIGESIKLSDTAKYFKLKTLNNQISGIDNVLIFRNGILYEEGKANLIDNGYNVFTYDEDYTGLEFKTFYYTKANTSKSNIFKIPNKEEIENAIISKALNSGYPSYIDLLRDVFDFIYDKTIKYDDNVSNSLKYIMGYDSSLISDLYINNSNIDIQNYTGQEILNKLDINGNLIMPRRQSKDNDNYIMIFVNNKLYTKYSELKYINNKFKVPFNSIDKDDKIEILFFKNVNNNIDKIKIYDRTPIKIYDIDNIKLFSTETKNKLFITNQDYDRVQYDVLFTYSINNDGTYNIILDDSFYYGKELSLASTRQFKYCYYNIIKDIIGFELPIDFNYCHDINRYMIFVNGQRLFKENYKLTVMTPTNPFDSLSIYVNTLLSKGDKIEIFYIPELLEEYIYEPSIPINGDILLDKSKLSYNFTKYLYMIFINGNKINIDNISDMGNRFIRIKNNIGTLKNLCILPYINSISELEDLFKIDDSTWDKFISSLPTATIDKLFNIYNTISNDQPDIKNNDNILDTKTVVYEIIKDYYIRATIDTTDPFVYDYDPSVISEDDKDSLGNYIIRLLDANIKDKMIHRY